MALFVDYGKMQATAAREAEATKKARALMAGFGLRGNGREGTVPGAFVVSDGGGKAQVCSPYPRPAHLRRTAGAGEGLNYGFYPAPERGFSSGPLRWT